MRLLKVAGVVVLIVGVAAAVVVLSPEASAQIMRWSSPGEIQRFELIGDDSGHVGLMVRDVESADQAKTRDPGGAFVTEVAKDSPAEKAGLKPNDVVVEFDGERVRSAAQFTRLVRETPAGRTVKLAYLRDRKRMDAEITPSRGTPLIDSKDIEDRVERALKNFKMPEWRADGRRFDFGMPAPARGRLGVTVQDLTPQLATYFGAKDGVLITSVSDDSPASRAGLKAGDVVTSINNSPVTSETELLRLLRRADEGAITIGVVRDKKPLTIKATLEDGAKRKIAVVRRGAVAI